MLDAKKNQIITYIWQINNIGVQKIYFNRLSTSRCAMLEINMPFLGEEKTFREICQYSEALI